MRSKAVARPGRRSDSTRAKRGGGRKATTFRLDPRLEKGLALLGEVRRVPLNRLVNEAVGEYLDTRAATVEAELEETLRRVKAYRQADADFESAISKFADAEAESAAQDPVEGHTTRAKGPAQRLVRELIRG
jgi:predicted transcriptional regulator